MTSRIKIFRLAYVLERMIYFTIDGSVIKFGFIFIYLRFNRFHGVSIHLLGVLSVHIHKANTCSYVSFDKLAVFIYCPHLVVKFGIADLQFIEMRMVWTFATMSAKSLNDVRSVLAKL